MSAKRKTSCDEDLACFTDLPNEIILMICRYLTPIQVLEVFLNFNERFYSCLSDYYRKLDFTQFSCQNFSFYMALLRARRIHPSTLTFSNALMMQQIETFFQRILPLISYELDHVLHLSLLECLTGTLFSINSALPKFKSLSSLHITEATSIIGESYTSYRVLEELAYFIFCNPFNRLIELSLITNDGLILSKTLSSNRNLRDITIVLHDINDLYVLLDGLVPNLLYLNVTISKSSMNTPALLPNCWPNQSMIHLKRLQLKTCKSVEFTFNELSNLIIPLINLNTLTLYIETWMSSSQRFVKGDELQMLFEQFLPQLEHFFCSIWTNNHIDMETFSTFNQRWPLKCCAYNNRSETHVYTVPWSFNRLTLSMLANDDANSVCPNVKYLTLDISSTSAYISRRFPNVDTLNILLECHLLHDNDLSLRHLRHLTMNNINVVPSSVIQRVHTLNLYNGDGLLSHSTIYPKVKGFSLKINENNSFEIVQSLIQHFPNVRSLEVPLQLTQKVEYYHSLNILLDGIHLPRLLFLKTNWIENNIYESRISLWLSSKTSLKFKPTLFCAYYEDNNLIVCL